MAHEVETMAYTNEVPWHGLGVYVAKAPNVKAMIKLAGIDWRVEKQPLQAGHFEGEGDKRKAVFNGRSGQVPNFFALTRDKDGRVFDVVGHGYVPTQNVEAFEFFNEFVEAGDASMETAGSLRGGQFVWGLAKLNRSFKLPGKDEVKGYLLCVCPHKKGKSLLFRSTAVRVVCANTLAMALGENRPEWRMVHRSTFGETMRQKAKETLGLSRERFDEFAVQAKKLKTMHMNLADHITVLAQVFQPDMPVVQLKKDMDSFGNRTMKRLMDVLERAPGADPKTAWGTINAVTYFCDHLASRSADKRLTNAWFGKTAQQKQKVLDLLLA